MSSLERQAENNAKTRQTDSQAENISVSQSFPFGRGRYKDEKLLPQLFVQNQGVLGTTAWHRLSVWTASLMMMASSTWVRRNCKNRINISSNIPENILKAFYSQQPVSRESLRACILHILFYSITHLCSRHDVIQSHIASIATSVQHTLQATWVCPPTVSVPLTASFCEMAFCQRYSYGWKSSAQHCGCLSLHIIIQPLA